MQELIKKNLLKEAIELASFMGWSFDILENASIAAGLDRATGRVLFPGGTKELLEFFVSYIDDLMMLRYKDAVHSGMRTHERIRECVIARLHVFQQYRASVTRFMSFCVVPFHMAFSLKILWRTVDLIWYEAGHDQSTDFNYYTKRAILSALYSNTAFYWISDTSEDLRDTIDFLDRGMENVHHKIAFLKKVRSVLN